MSNASHLPKSRLNQIAQRKLAALNVPTHMSPDEEVLEGELRPPGALINPLNGQHIRVVRFVAEEHDKMRFTYPAILARLPPVAFYDFNNLDGLWPQLESKMKAYVTGMQKQALRLKPLGLQAQGNADNGCFYAFMVLETLGTLVLEGDDKSITAVHFSSLNPTRVQSMWMPRVPVELGDGSRDKTDVELSLSAMVEHAPEGCTPAPREFEPPPAVEPEPLEASAPKPAQAAAPLATGAPRRSAAAVFSVPKTVVGTRPIAPAVERTREAPPAATPVPAAMRPSPQHAASAGLTLMALAKKFGAETALSDGITCTREIVANGRRLRFTAAHQQGPIFSGLLTTEGGNVLWQERFALDGFPGIDAVVAAIAGGPPAGAAAPMSVPARGPVSTGTAPAAAMSPEPMSVDASAAFGMLPQPGEQWSMRVLVETEAPTEIRYVAINSDGQPFGAARVLQRTEFMTTFQQHGGGYRMLVRIQGRDAQNIHYVQMSPDGEPLEPVRVVPMAAFLAHFVPDAAAY